MQSKYAIIRISMIILAYFLGIITGLVICGIVVFLVNRYEIIVNKTVNTLGKRQRAIIIENPNDDRWKMKDLFEKNDKEGRDTILEGII